MVGSCSALDEGFVKDHERLRGEMKEPHVWVGAWLGERMPNVTREENLFPLMYTLGHFRLQLHYLIFSLLCFVLSCPLAVLSRQTIRD